MYVFSFFGGDDENVSIQKSYRVYDEIFKAMGKKNYELNAFPNTRHFLLNSEYQDPKTKFIMDSFTKGKDIFIEFFTIINQ